ncbi:hypothetical protein FQA39_LY10751 [Lamprigera yunnana]|nr:hypothetical protein FQA39_LY10751 [Lamprigera yunnana]
MFVKIFIILFLFVICFRKVMCFGLKYPHKNEYEIVYFSLPFPEEDKQTKNKIDFTAFGRSISLTLNANENLMSPYFKAYLQNENRSVRIMKIPENCHYLHRDSSTTAAISICEPRSIVGLVFMENTTYEIRPLTSHMHSVLNVNEPITMDTERSAHVIRKAVLDSDWYEPFSTERRLYLKKIHNAKLRKGSSYTAELALFFDAAAYKIFAPYFDYDQTKLMEMLLVYINGVQALYHHPTLGTDLDLVLVRIDIMQSQPASMPHYDGEQTKLLDSFCSYQKSLNSENDDDTDHWDMALYISGLDFFAYDDGNKNIVTMGLAAVGGVCYSQYACVIAELGTTNMFGKIYPSAGFTSVFVLAHEIGHNLGMNHDGTKNDCPKDGYIMSASRGDTGEAQWSSCSAQVMTTLKTAKCLHDYTGVLNSNFDHTRFKDVPGLTYTAKKQCEILLKDKDAVVSPHQKVNEICYSLECKTPHRSGTYHSGPALEGTYCGKEMYCSGGECVVRKLSSNEEMTKYNLLKNREIMDYIALPNQILEQRYDVFDFK